MKIFDQLLKLINNSNFWTFISITVVAISSYSVAKYNASKPSKIKVKQLQLENVYLPLFRLFEAIPQNPPIDHVQQLYTKTSLILDNYYELVFPQLHELNRKLASQLKQKQPYDETISYMRHLITIDYELLKKSLGYPSESLYAIIIRMTYKHKKYLIWLIFRTFALIFISLFVLLPLSNPNYRLPIGIILFITSISFIYTGIIDIKSVIKH